MHAELVIHFLMRLLTHQGGTWISIFGEATDPVAGISLAAVTVVALAVQLWLIYRTGRRGEQTTEDSEAAVHVYLPVCLHGDPLFYHRSLRTMNPGKPGPLQFTTRTAASTGRAQRNYWIWEPMMPIQTSITVVARNRVSRDQQLDEATHLLREEQPRCGILVTRHTFTTFTVALHPDIAHGMIQEKDLVTL